MKNYYYMFELQTVDVAQDKLQECITKSLSAINRRAPIFHGIYSLPDGKINAAWYIDNKALKPNVKTSKLLMELATLMMQLERIEGFATLRVNTRQV